MTFNIPSIIRLAICITILSAQASFAQLDTLQRVVPGKTNAKTQLKKPYVILISADGFRWDYAEKYKAQNLLKFAASGVKAESMIPSFPASTLANHFTLVSGLYPGHSGIVGNTFYDPARKEMFKGSDGTWFGEEPLWVTAEKLGMLTASFYWINTQAPIQKIKPTYYYAPNKSKKVSANDWMTGIETWLNLSEEKRPHFIACHIGDTDHAGHNFGPDSKETEEAVQFVDESVAKMVAAAKRAGVEVNFIFVSDHGMFKVDREHPLVIPASISKDKFVIISQGNYVNLHAKNPADILPMYNQLKAEKADGYTVVLKKDLPADLHFGTKDDKYNRVGDILLMAKHPRVFSPRPNIGAHGFSAYEVKDNLAIFYAWGPAFKEHLQIAPFENIEVYNVMTQILGIKGLPNDGKGSLAKQILK